MNFDRWGYFDSDGYHYWPDIRRGADHYGFDPDDPVYRERIPREHDRTPCPSCRRHDVRERCLPCDVAMARAQDMEEAGYPATFCRSCYREMPVRSGQLEFLPKCFRCEAAHGRRRPQITNGGAYVADGLGCVEKVPSWMVDWDGNRSAGGGVK